MNWTSIVDLKTPGTHNNNANAPALGRHKVLKINWSSRLLLLAYVSKSNTTLEASIVHYGVKLIVWLKEKETMDVQKSTNRW